MNQLVAARRTRMGVVIEQILFLFDMYALGAGLACLSIFKHQCGP